MGKLSKKLPAAYCQLPVWLLLLIAVISCQRRPQATPAESNRVHPTVASLVPAATDLIVQMGLGNHLLAISNYDDAADLHLIALPRAGDYQSIDWELLSDLRPDILVIFESPQRIPAGLSEHANALHIQLVNVRTETITDILAEAARLGRLLGEQTKSQQAIAHFQNRLTTLRHRTAALPKIRTLLVLDPATLGVIGTHNFLDDALQIAGGKNVIQAAGWPTIDREMLQSLHPQAIIALLAEQSPQSIAAARKFLDSQSTPSCRTTLIAHWYAQQSSFSVADMADELCAALHPKQPTTAPGTGPS